MSGATEFGASHSAILQRAVSCCQWFLTYPFKCYSEIIYYIFFSWTITTTCCFSYVFFGESFFLTYLWFWIVSSPSLLKILCSPSWDAAHADQFYDTEQKCQLVILVAEGQSTILPCLVSSWIMPVMQI